VHFTAASRNSARTVLSKMTSLPSASASRPTSASGAAAARPHLRRQGATEIPFGVEALVRGVVAKIWRQGNAQVERLRSETPLHRLATLGRGSARPMQLAVTIADTMAVERANGTVSQLPVFHPLRRIARLIATSVAVLLAVGAFLTLAESQAPDECCSWANSCSSWSSPLGCSHSMSSCTAES
jgi:hypothetical protein